MKKNEICTCSEEEKKDCRYRIEYPEDNNCTLEAVDKHGNMTLQEVSKRLGLSIVRISQIEKQALKKLSKRIKT